MATFAATGDTIPNLQYKASSLDLKESDEKAEGVDFVTTKESIYLHDDIDWDSPEYRDIPQIVRDVVSFDDDPTISTITFRTVVLSAFYVAIGACVGQLSFYRTTSATFSVFFVILTSWPFGRALARVLPAWRISLGPLGSFSLNPGPFSTKEHVLIGMAANAGASGNWATYLPANAKIYYDIDMHPAVALFFGWATAFIGYSFAALVRQILIYDPQFLFPLSLQQVTLYRSMHGTSEEHDIRTRRQMNVFWILCVAMFAWQFFPEFIFPMTAALAPICWFGRKNHTANFVGSGIGGIGVLNFTLNWSNITSTIITQPYFVQVILFTGFVITTWILIPIAYFGNLWGSPKYKVMSNGVFTKNGTAYPFLSMLTSEGQLNQTVYDEVGLVYAGAQYMWAIFFWYASYISAFVWMGLFAGPKVWAVIKSHYTKKNVHNDKLSNIMKAYPEVPLWQWAAIFLASAVTLLVIVLKGNIYMPLFTYFVAIAFGGAATLPMSLVYAISGFSMKVGLFNELIYGYMIDVPGSSPHPLGQLAYRIISGNVWYDVRTVIEDQKIGHYMHIAPRAVIFSQILGSVIGLPVNYAIMRWVLSSKMDYLREIVDDPNGQWTAQDLKSYNTAGVQYALVGPRRLFQDASYTPLWYGFMTGAVAPLVVWLLHRRFKRANFHLWNTTIFFANMAEFRGNISTGPLTQIILGTIWNFYLYRYRYKFWSMWAYITGAALDTGFSLNLLFIFATLAAAGVTMPKWWGNNEQSVERCFGK
ncbi:OPT oligopeptide transporter [Cylindrobasidium torrendii FP15055 ss-10]|uniref:OPT oligopeptide transporter n=1 Tax=Cylindrobasidium torrendii FP15055 ss-10 TaxID=1314674 RepID=A0A0D7BGT6_9AGAR|nr:OPT oligopeptide transporter [Cylindrobasidium torrendii FP15055 ss-10]